jgi:hypothetical protein
VTAIHFDMPTDFIQLLLDKGMIPPKRMVYLGQ